MHRSSWQEAANQPEITHWDKRSRLGVRKMGFKSKSALLRIVSSLARFFLSEVRGFLFLIELPWVNAILHVSNRMNTQRRKEKTKGNGTTHFLDSSGGFLSFQGHQRVGISPLGSVSVLVYPFSLLQPETPPSQSLRFSTHLGSAPGSVCTPGLWQNHEVSKIANRSDPRSPL